MGSRHGFCNGGPHVDVVWCPVAKVGDELGVVGEGVEGGRQLLVVLRSLLLEKTKNYPKTNIKFQAPELLIILTLSTQNQDQNLLGMSRSVSDTTTVF